MSNDPDMQPGSSNQPDSDPAPSPEDSRGIAAVWERLARMGLAESALRVTTSVVSISLILVVAWFMGKFYLQKTQDQRSQALAAAVPTAGEPTRMAMLKLPPLEMAGNAWQGITRLAQLHTTLPERPRYEVTTYTVVKGDTIFGIAEKFNLKPETIMWANFYTLGDNPHIISPGMELNILPVNGVYHKWSEGEGLNGVSSFYHVKPEDIINWPGNQLTLESVGDFAAPNIPAGTWLVVPGGYRPIESVATPRITRGNPSKAKYLGAGYCANAVEGITGNGTFVWPTTDREISGYGFSGVHPAIDIGGAAGNPIFAADTGVVVYAGWSDLGYGNIIVLDHGNGWQTYYAHLSVIYVSCGQGIVQAATIGAMGSTGNSSGPHLHFEMRHDEYGKVNPMDFLQ